MTVIYGEASGGQKIAPAAIWTLRATQAQKRTTRLQPKGQAAGPRNTSKTEAKHTRKLSTRKTAPFHI